MKKTLLTILFSSLLLVGCANTNDGPVSETNSEAVSENVASETESRQEDKSQTDSQTEESETQGEQITVDQTSVQPVIDRIYQYIAETYGLASETIFYMVTQEGQQMQFEFRENVAEGGQAPLIGLFNYDFETGRLTTTNELGEEIVIEEDFQLE